MFTIYSKSGRILGHRYNMHEAEQLCRLWNGYGIAYKGEIVWWADEN